MVSTALNTLADISPSLTAAWTELADWPSGTLISALMITLPGEIVTDTASGETPAFIAITSLHLFAKVSLATSSSLVYSTFFIVILKVTNSVSAAGAGAGSGAGSGAGAGALVLEVALVVGTVVVGALVVIRLGSQTLFTCSSACSTAYCAPEGLVIFLLCEMYNSYTFLRRAFVRSQSNSMP